MLKDKYKTIKQQTFTQHMHKGRRTELKRKKKDKLKHLGNPEYLEISRRFL